MMMIEILFICTFLIQNCMVEGSVSNCDIPESSLVDWSGLYSYDALVQLWSSSKTAAFFDGGFPIPDFNYSNVNNAIANGFVDYYSGRVIKTDFSCFPKLDSAAYDRDIGKNAMESAKGMLKMQTKICYPFVRVRKEMCKEEVKKEVKEEREKNNKNTCMIF